MVNATGTKNIIIPSEPVIYKKIKPQLLIQNNTNQFAL